MRTIQILILSALVSLAQASPEKWEDWAKWVEAAQPISDAQGHGPDIGSDEWTSALDKKLGITDKEGHGPDLGSAEWRKAVEKKLASPKVELLSSHDTKAKFTGITDHKCMGLTSFCPDRCGHSGKLASFEITEYIAYEKPGEYGDPKQETFQILIKDNMGNAKVPDEIAKDILALKAGDAVHLQWNHNYVTKDGTSSPDRPIAKLELLK